MLCTVTVRRCPPMKTLCRCVVWLLGAVEAMLSSCTAPGDHRWR
jgi:hypothetical protein